MTKKLKLDQIRDGGAQMRVEMTETIIEEYAEAMVSGDVFPPVIVFFDGTDHWAADGYHRIGAAKRLDRTEIEADVREGTRRDAWLFGIGANAKHGLRRTQADKRKAIVALLADRELGKKSDRKIAQLANCDHKTVGKIRRELSGEIPTRRSRGGEIPANPKVTEQVSPAKPSVAGSFLESISDDDLKAECERRGWRVEA
jgi:hypothetical protein